MTLKIKNKVRLYRTLRVDLWGLYKLGYWLGSNRYTFLRKKYLRLKDKFPSLRAFEKASKFKIFYLVNKKYFCLFKFKRISRIFYKKFLDYLELKELLEKRYIYRTDIREPFHKFRRFNKRFVSIRAVRFFYLTLTYRQFNKMADKAQIKDGFFESNFILALEGRLISFLYRTGFVFNMFDSLYLVKNSFVTLNRKVINYPNAVAKPFDILSFHPFIKRKILFDLLCRRIIVGSDLRLIRWSKFLFISTFFLFSYIYRGPFETDLIMPHKYLNIYRATKFAC